MFAGEAQDLEHQQALERPGVIVESQGPELAALQLAFEVGGVPRPVQTDSLAGAGSDARPEPHGGQVEHSRGGDALGLQNLGVRQRQHV